MTLAFVGTPVVANPDLVYRDYLRTVKAQDLTEAQIDAAINAKLGGYASISYVDTKDGLLATQSYIDAQDNLRLRLSQKNIANGVPGLDPTGKVDPSLIYQATNDQKYNQGPWSPSAYNTIPLTSATTTEVPLYTCGVTNPGFPYRLVVFGLADARSNLDTEYPVIRVRVGSASGEIIAVGRGPSDAMENALFTDTFNRVAPDLGLNWSETYYEGGLGHYECDGAELVWQDEGNEYNSLRARRINAYDEHTGTDYQRVIATVGSVIGESPFFTVGDQALRLYGRMNETETQYVYFDVTHETASFYYANNGDETQLGGTAAVSQSTNKPFILITGTPDTPRSYYLYKETTLVLTVNDTGAVTAMGPTNRGWGFGARAAPRNFGQTTPPRLSNVSVNDAVFNYGAVRIVPRRLDQMSILGAATTLHVSVLRSGSAAQVGVTNVYPKLHVVAVPA